MYGHQGDVTSVFVSKAYNVIVTGSEVISFVLYLYTRFRSVA